MDADNSKHSILAAKITEQFKSIPSVEAIALGGSQTTGSVDNFSDIDLYVFSDTGISFKIA